MRYAPIRRVLRVGATIVALTAFALAGFAAVFVRHATRELPTPRALRANALTQDIIVLDRSGQRLAALRIGPEGHREVVPFNAMSIDLRDAVVASEDARFWSHRGVDPRAIARAVKATVVDRRPQGASTITQQLLKLTMLGGRPTVLRKIEEWMLAARFESLFTKEELLALYLNAVHLGEGNAGVEAASRRLFGVSASAVSLAQAALLVGAIPAPSHTSPFCDPDRARTQQQRVLDRVRAAGTRSAEQVAAARAAPIAFTLADDTARSAVSPVDFATAALAAAPGDTIVTTVDRELQGAASRALADVLARHAVRVHEHRGPRFALIPDVVDRWRVSLAGLRATLRSWGTARDDLLVYDLRDVVPSARVDRLCHFGGTIFRRAAAGGFASGIVTAVKADRAMLDLGDLTGALIAKDVAWTGKPLVAIAPVGAVLDVLLPASIPSKKNGAVRVTLVPRPVAEGAVVALDPRTREVIAIVGGVEPARGDRNRAVHARRQIGSTVKPFVYGAALAAGTLVPDATLHDVAIQYVDPWSGDVWEPTNWYEGHEGTMSPDAAIARSVNAVTVQLALATGMERVASFVEAVTPVAAVPMVPAVALGTIERTPLELAAAYATIASGGIAGPVAVIREVRRGGQFLTPATVALRATFTPELVAALDWLLASPVHHARGTARALADLDLGIRGKTGTTNDAHDAWFVGYTPELVVAVWVGYDTPRSLRGRGGEESGTSLAVPIAARVFSAARTRGLVHPTALPEAPTEIAATFGDGAPASLLDVFAEVAP